MTLRLAWFTTARGTISLLLFERVQAAIDAGQLDAQIAVVFCNRERGQAANTDAFLDRIEATGTPLVCLSSGAWRKQVAGDLSTPGESLAPWRADFDRAAREAITPYRPDMGVLAGYMLITTAELCEHLPLLNLHPAEPGGPVGTWQEVIRTLIDQHAPSNGLMLQRVTVDLDRGPIISLCHYPIRTETLADLWSARSGPAQDDEPLFHAIRAEGVKREPVFLIESLRAFADGRAPVPTSGAPTAPLDLSDTVEIAIRNAGD